MLVPRTTLRNSVRQWQARPVQEHFLLRNLRRRKYAIEATPDVLKNEEELVRRMGKDPTTNKFVQQRKLVKQHAPETANLWRKLAIYVAGPAILIASINAWKLWNEHWKHFHEVQEEMRQRKVEYPYQNIRVKAYPWGDGDKTLFWNDKVNYHKRD